MAAALLTWLPWAALLVTLVGALAASPAGLRALPLLAVSSVIAAFLLAPSVSFDPAEVASFFGSLGLFAGALMAVNHSGPSRDWTVLAVRRFAFDAEEYRDRRMTVILGHASFDARQAVLKSARGSIDITATAGTVLIQLPAEWRLVVRHCPVSVFLTEHGVPRDSAGSPIFDVSVRGVLGRVEVSRQ